MSHYVTRTPTRNIIHILLPTTCNELLTALVDGDAGPDDQVILQSHRSGMLTVEVGKGRENRTPIIDSYEPPQLEEEKEDEEDGNNR